MYIGNGLEPPVQVPRLPGVSALGHRKCRQPDIIAYPSRTLNDVYARQYCLSKQAKLADNHKASILKISNQAAGATVQQTYPEPRQNRLWASQL
ncbi:hypothetical protein [uncultured Desulfovibrio sp.]|uniref:hypothetical protein n=1 Tax=uncultured Desulfovibrio sp. TaxID=167968 RepID=UPI000AE655F0|nr:hypothetical protein [uncultured Desulfovibrio sp.]